MPLNFSAFEKKDKLAEKSFNFSAFNNGAESSPGLDMKAFGKTASPTPKPSSTEVRVMPSIVSSETNRTQTSTPAMIEPGTGTIEQAGKLGVDIGRSIARNIGSAGMTISGAVRGEASPEPLIAEDFQSFFGQALFETVFGKGEKVASIEERVVEAEDKVKKWGADLTELAKNPDLNDRERFVVTTLSDVATRNPGVLAFGGVMGSVGLDLTGFGGLEKNALKAIVKETTEGGAELLLRGMGVSDDLAKNFAPEVVKVTTDAEARKLFNSIADLQGSTRFAPTQAIDDIADEFKSLAEEARKYESAEEFVKGQIPVYHGSPTPLKKFSNKKGGVFFTDEYADATGFAGTPDNVYEGYLNFKKPLVIDAKGRKWDDLDTKWGRTTQEVVSNARKEGYDGVTFRNIIDNVADDADVGTPGTIHFAHEPETAFLNESQLTEFYNGVVKGAGDVGGKKPPPLDARGKKLLGEEPPRKITKTEPQLLKDRIRAEARGAKAGVQAGRAIARDEIYTKLRASTEATDDVRKTITDFVKENLDPDDRGKALVLVRDAKTQKDVVKAFARVERWAEDAEKKAIRNEIISMQKKIADSPSVAVDYKQKIKEVLGDYELKGHRDETIERLKATEEFFKTEAAKGNDVEMPKRVLKSLQILNRKPFEEITVNQLKGIQAEIELLEEVGRTKARTFEAIWDAKKAKILDEVKLQDAPPINQIELLKPKVGERLNATQKMKNVIWTIGNKMADIDRAISPMDTVFDLLDGGKATYNGANFRFFKGQVDAGYGRYITRKDTLQEPVIELASRYKLDDTNFERMGVVAARDQDGGIEKLIASGLSEEEINAVKLSREEQEVLDLMRETFDSQFPEIQDTMRRVYNQPVEKVKNYFSFMTDWKAMDESEVFERFGSQMPEQYGAPKKNVEAGFTKSRVGGGQKIKINALDVFLQHTDNTSYLLELGETSKMLGEVAASPEYAEKVGDAGQLMVREWLDVIARKGGASGASQIAILDTLRKNVGVGILGMKLSTVAIQPTALIDGMGFIGVPAGLKGTNNFITDPAWRKFVAGMPEISDRMGGEFALRELTDDNWLQEIQRKGFIPMQKLDQMTAGAIASGAYERKMIELGREIDFTKYDPEALEYAQLAVRRTQSSGSFKDVPLAVSRGALTGNRSLDRAILQFQTFLLTRWSRIRHDAIRAGINTKDPTKAVPIFAALIMAGATASGIRLGVNKVQDFITGREDDDSITEDLTKSFLFEMTGNVPFLGTATSMAVYDGEFFPILDAPKGVISGLNRAITSESQGAKLRGINEAVGSFGALFGVPGSAQGEQLMRGFLQEEKKSKSVGGADFGFGGKNVEGLSTIDFGF